MVDKVEIIQYYHNDYLIGLISHNDCGRGSIGEVLIEGIKIDGEIPVDKDANSVTVDSSMFSTEGDARMHRPRHIMKTYPISIDQAPPSSI